MSTMAQLRYSPCLSNHHFNPYRAPDSTSTLLQLLSFSSPPPCAPNLSISPPQFYPKPNFLLPEFRIPCATVAGGGDGSTGGWSGGGGAGGSKGDDDSSSADDSSSLGDGLGPIGAFLNGWRSRVAADPQFPFKVLMEEIVGVGACVLGDMVSRPNFGLNELDFVFSTLVVGSILNFTLMYLLAPTMSSSSSAGLPSIFADCPTSHMFEPGPFSVANRVGTFVYKGAVFAAVGFAAGLVGTALSNGLIRMRKKMDPNFETPNKPPPTLLNALTWATHMGLSSNFRYQTLNGVEFLLAKGLPSIAFKTSVVVLRMLNNVAGGMTFVMLAKLTGSQTSSSGGGGGGGGGADAGKLLTVEEEVVESLPGVTAAD